MKPESKLLLEKILKCKSLSVAKTYAESIQVIEEQTNIFTVKLQPGFDGQPLINCIKELRELIGAGLKEARDMVVQGNTLTGLDIHQAQKLVSRMTIAGARIVFQ
jgi:ribosomal protein L7/L12